jgi:chemotaxis protein CheC
MNLSALQIDYIKELFNISLGQAAVELSELVDDEIELSVPSFSLLSIDELITHLHLSADTPVTAVKMRMDGGLSGDGMLIFPEKNSLDLVKAVAGEQSEDLIMTDLEAEALTEIASIILNQIISTISSMLSIQVKTRIPICTRDILKNILFDNGGKSRIVMFVGMSFVVKELALGGDVLFIQDIESVELFTSRVASVLATLGFE